MTRRFFRTHCKKPLISLISFLSVFASFQMLSRAENTVGSVQAFVDAAGSEKGMTLWQVLQSGGWVMIVLSVLSLGMTALIVYLFARLRVGRLIPKNFLDEAIAQLRRGNTGVVKTACEGKSNIAARILSAYTEKAGVGPLPAKEAVEITARQEVSSLWSSISFLSDIAAVAPMLGLLGTVIGMIEAFNAIAFQTAVVKPILLAGGVSKAMVTTAAGLVIAIIAMIFFSVFRQRVQNITNMIEVMTSEVLELPPRTAKG